MPCRVALLSRHVGSASLVLLLALGLHGARADDESQRPSAEEVGALVRGLSAEDYFEREAATRKLWEAGPEVAAAALERVRDGRDPEAAMRARKVLWNFAHGVLVDTPPEVVAMIERFRRGNAAVRVSLFRDLVDRGEVTTVRRLFLLVPDGPMQKPLGIAIDAAIAKRLPTLFEARRYDEALAWLDMRAERAATNRRFGGDRNAFLLLTGRLDERLGDLRGALEGDGDVARQTELARLSILGGDLDAAHMHAEKSKDVTLRQEVAFRRGDWGALAEAGLTPGGEGVERLGFRAACLRLAGREEEFAKAVGELVVGAKGSPDAARLHGEALLITEQWDEALAIFRAEETTRTFAFELLCARERQEEAFELIGLPRDGSGAAAWCPDDVGSELVEGARAFELALRVVVEVHRVRGRDEARGLLEAIGTKLADGAEDDKGRWSRLLANRLPELVELEVQLGFEDLALEQATLALVHYEVRPSERVLEPLFDCWGSTVLVWWRYRLGQAEGESPEAALRWVHGLIRDGERSVPPDRFATMAREVVRMGDPKVREDRNHHAWAAVQAAMQREAWDLAAELMAVNVELDPDETELYQSGEVAAKRERWNEAASFFERALSGSRETPTMLQAGLAHREAGAVEKGDRLLELARVDPLADGARRRSGAELLAELGRSGEAQREWETILLVDEQAHLDSASSVQVAFARLGAALGDDDPLRAADCWERFRLYLLKTNSSYSEGRRYLAIAHLLHRTRARGLIAAGEFDEAFAEAERAYRAWPGNIELGIELVPMFEEADRPSDADRVFDLVHDVAASRAERFPESGNAHNDLAWLQARCGRRLDEALAHAERAVVLEPGSAAYLDTLAEVCFRRGDRERAIELARRCVVLDPKGAHYREQLARFEKRAEGSD